MVSPIIFNGSKTDYEKTPIILGQPRGLFDSITQQYPDQTDLYRKLRMQDWTEFEFAFQQCRNEFADPALTYYSKRMRKQLAYQWQTDSSAASTIAGILSCVLSSTELYTGYQKVSENEAIHALTYSEIVKQGFDNPLEALEEFKADIDAMDRIEVVGDVFEQAFVSAHRWALYQARPHLYPLNDKEIYEVYDHMFLYFVALLCMERCQFMTSFSDTFGICELNIFQPIGDAVQRIAQDELEIHVPFGKYTIRDLLKTDRGSECFKNNYETIVKLVNGTMLSERNWVEMVHRDGKELPTVTPQQQIDFAHLAGTDVASFLGIEKDVDFPLVYDNPIGFMSKRVNLGSVQGSPMETPVTAYAVNAVRRDDEGKRFNFVL